MTTQRRRTAPIPSDPLTPFNVNIPVSLVARVQDFADTRGLSKAGAARVLLIAGLEADPDGQIAGQTKIGGGD